MEILIVVALVILLLCLAVAPCMLIWLCSNLWLPERYKLPPYKMTALCVLLAVTTSIALNLELEGRIGSAPIALLVLSFFWALILLLAISLYKYIAYVTKHSNT
jgi:hypothetical protein